MKMREQFWWLALGAMGGIAIGVVWIGAPLRDSEWMTPVVVGPTLGAFLAAGIGLSGTLFSDMRAEARANADVLRKRKEKAASIASELRVIALRMGYIARSFQKLKTGLDQAALAEIKRNVFLIRNAPNHAYNGASHHLAEIHDTYALWLPRLWEMMEVVMRSIEGYVEWAEKAQDHKVGMCPEHSYTLFLNFYCAAISLENLEPFAMDEYEKYRIPAERWMLR